MALLVATPGQIVYIEQPEIHLHPKAQYKMAELLAEAANRGVKVVIETHSSLLLRGIQTFVTQGKLAPNRVKLHWFTRDNDGATVVNATDLDENGAFGEEWPEDFGGMELHAEPAYLDAVMHNHEKSRSFCCPPRWWAKKGLREPYQKSIIPENSTYCPQNYFIDFHKSLFFRIKSIIKPSKISFNFRKNTRRNIMMCYWLNCRVSLMAIFKMVIAITFMRFDL